MGTDIFEIISYLATAAGVIFAGVTYYLDKRRERKTATIRAYQNLDETTFAELLKHQPSEIRAICENKQSGEFKQLGRYLANIELFCIGLKEGIYDFDTFYAIAHGYFDNERGTIKPRIVPIIEVKLNNAKEDYFSHIHWVWQKMDKYR